MFIYNLNEKGLKKFEKDINDRIKEVFEEYFIKSSIEDKLNIYSCKY